MIFVLESVCYWNSWDLSNWFLFKQLHLYQNISTFTSPLIKLIKSNGSFQAMNCHHHKCPCLGRSPWTQDPRGYQDHWDLWDLCDSQDWEFRIFGYRKFNATTVTFQRLPQMLTSSKSCFDKVCWKGRNRTIYSWKPQDPWTCTVKNSFFFTQ